MGISVNQSLTIVSKDASNNTAQVRYIVQCTTSGDSWNGNTQTGTFNIDGTNYYNDYTLPQNTTTTVFDKTVTINNASGKTVGASYSFPTTSYYGTQTGNTSVYIDLPRYLNFINNYVYDYSLDFVRVDYSTDSARDWTEYSLNGGNWIAANDWIASDSKSGYYIISNLNPNTQYSIKTRCKRADSQLWTESETLTVTTKDISRITSCSDIILR